VISDYDILLVHAAWKALRRTRNWLPEVHHITVTMCILVDRLYTVNSQLSIVMEGSSVGN
jgi:hypothetical protein